MGLVMNFKLVLLLWLNYSSAQNPNCDYYQQVAVGEVYYVNNSNYPGKYPAGLQCRWTAVCPQGYNCKLECPSIDLPQTALSELDRVLVSRTGDPQLTGTDTYSSVGSLTATSTGQTISFGLISSPSSPGGTFSCRLTAQAATTPTTCSCGQRRQLRIVGGAEAAINEYRMMARLVDRTIWSHQCGGTIISVQHILSTAHCMRAREGDLRVVVGEHGATTGDSSEPKTWLHAIEKIIIHPQFSASNYDYDIAIVVTETPLKFNEFVGPACLPFKFNNTDFAGQKVTALGWGTQFFGEPKSNMLLKADVDVISQSTCRSLASATDRQMCTFTPGINFCQNDSGGPLLYTDPDTGRLFLVGIISSGRSCEGQTDILPAISTRVTALLDWILTNTPGTEYCRN